MILNPFSEEAKTNLNFTLDTIDECMVEDAIQLFFSVVKKEERNIKDDIKSFHILCMALSKSPVSLESREFVKEYAKLSRKELNLKIIQKQDISEIKGIINYEPTRIPRRQDFQTMENREWSYNDIKIPYKDLLSLNLLGNEQKNIYLIPWTQLEGMDFTQFYIINGRAILNESAITHVYEIAYKKRIAQHLRKLKEELPKLKFQDKIISKIKGSVGEVTHIGAEGTELSKGIYPPCINAALKGVGVGGRNFAITMVLTPFLSYARLFPTTKVFSEEFVPELDQKAVEALEREVLPLLYNAAESCEPPFLAEEKMNIIYHLGFGLKTELDLDNYNKSKWYLPPSCEKIKHGCPEICRPDEFCNKRWYSLKKRELLEKPNTQTSGGKIINSLNAMKTKEALGKLTGLEEKELETQIRALLKAGTIGEKRISSPFMYYLLRRRC